MMTKTEFLESKRYLHLADNKAINSSDKFAKRRPLFNAINEQCILNYQPSPDVSVDDAMVPYSGKQGAKQYIQGKPIKFGFKLWVMATLLAYCIQSDPYADKDSILQEYENIGLGLGASIVAQLVSKLPIMQVSNYQIAIENYSTSPALLRHLRAMGAAATGEVRAYRMVNAQLQHMVKMNREKLKLSDVATDVSSNITAVSSKDNKVVIVISTLYTE